MKHSWILAVALVAAACSPQVYPLYLDVRQPSSSGIDLNKKDLSVVYMDGQNGVDSLFDRQAASTLVRVLEEDYFDGREVVGLYHVPQADSITLDLMHSLVMDTEGDVVFLLHSHLSEPSLEANTPVSGALSADSAYVCHANVPVHTLLSVYDSMGKDAVQSFQGTAILRTTVYNSGLFTEDGLRSLAMHSLAQQAQEVGQRVAKRFLSSWKTETFSFYYFDDFDAYEWWHALEDANDGQMHKAIDRWGVLAKEANASIKRGCACYNIALAFYLMGDYQLASRWLDQAESIENVPMVPTLRKRLASHLEKF